MSRQSETKKKLVFDMGSGSKADRQADRQRQAQRPPTLIDPHTKQPMLRAPVIVDLAELQREYQEKLQEERRRHQERAMTAAPIVPQRYALMPGRVLVSMRPAETAWDAAGLVEMESWRKEMMQEYEPWGTILMVGDEFYTDHGQLMKPDKEWVPGRMALINTTGASPIDLEVPGSETGEMMKLLVVGFRAIVLVDKGAPTNVDEVKNDVEGGAV